jgi:hypothetical protein
MHCAAKVVTFRSTDVHRGLWSVDMGMHDTILKNIVNSKALLDKLGNSISAKEKADIAKQIQSITADYRKAIGQAVQRKAANDHINMLRKQVDDYIKKLPDEKPLDTLIGKVNDDAAAAATAVQNLADDLKKKKEAKGAKLLDDIASAFNGVSVDTSSIVVFIGTS